MRGEEPGDTDKLSGRIRKCEEVGCPMTDRLSMGSTAVEGIGYLTPQERLVEGSRMPPPTRGLKGEAKVCFFAHFDKDNQVDAHVFHYLNQLSELGFAIIFVTTSSIDEPTIDVLGDICRDVICRGNGGMDFGSWAVAYERYGDEIDGDLLLANDSVYGPIGSLGAAIDLLCSTQADFYGMVESFQPSPHLQSWFILLRPAAHTSAAFREIMAKPYETMTKADIIVHGEIATTRSLVASGFRYHALFMVCSGSRVIRWIPTNPTHLLWRQLIETYRVPFVKVELLRDNVLDLPRLENWAKVISAQDVSLASLIKAHLRRVTSVRRTARGSLARSLYWRCLARAYVPTSGAFGFVTWSASVVAICLAQSLRRFLPHKRRSGSNTRQLCA